MPGHLIFGSQVTTRQMKFFRCYPFVRILGFQLAGTGIAGFFPDAGFLLWGFLLILTLWMIRLFREKKYPFDLVHSAILSLLIVAIAFLNARYNPSSFTAANDGRQNFEAVVLNNPIEKARSWQTVVRIRQSGPFQIRNQKLLVYLQKDDKAMRLRPGDHIVARSAISGIQNPGNPYEFDYRKYMERKGIRLRTYLASPGYLIRQEDNPSLSMTFKRLQKKLVSELKSKLASEQAFQVVSALALGYRDELTREIRSYFISTGAMHILAVSGLHVAMIFLFLNRLFSFLKRFRSGRSSYLLIMLSGLWGYAMLTGFSPPVQRAAVMFSFILVGNTLNRPASIYNSISASAFFQLLFNPSQVLDVGFQLSYAAVISIVFFYPKLIQPLKTKNWLLNRAWQLCCVSIAAQIGTFALSIYYFHQFPVYACLSNFVVVPAGYLILALTAIFFLLCPLQNLALPVAQFLSRITDLTLFLLKRIGELPFAVIEDLSLSLVQLACLFLLLGLIIFFMVYRKHAFLFAGLVVIALFQLDGLVQKISLWGQQKLIVYRSDETLIHLINGRENYLVTDSEIPPDPVLYQNVVLKLKLKEPLIIHRTSSHQKRFRDLIIQPPVIQFAGKSLILSKKGPVRFPGGDTRSFRFGLLNLKQTGQGNVYLETD